MAIFPIPSSSRWSNERLTTEHQATARLIALLGEVDTRRLYAPQGYSSLFTYCVQSLHLSEPAAYLRITAARAARRFPAILELLSQGALHLTAISLLAPHLTANNHAAVLDAARHKSKREVEQLIARLQPQPDAPAVVRKLPVPRPLTVPQACPTFALVEATEPPATRPAVIGTPARPSEVKPLAPERYKVQFTVGRDTHEKLRQVQDLLRHAVPSGDLAVIFDRALTLLLAEIAKTKLAATDRPQRARESNPHSRHIPARVRREVWRRDGGRCAFQGEQGRCTETGFLEFHHVVPFAEGGATTSENLELRCRTHNAYEADQHFAGGLSFRVRETRAIFGAGNALNSPSGPPAEIPL